MAKDEGVELVGDVDGAVRALDSQRFNRAGGVGEAVADDYG